ncbi:MAG: DUF1385 domain-containing protein [Clostridiales bacterium]|nr:DUF1385 domain-containing protein [Clostridiales bacterium]
MSKKNKDNQKKCENINTCSTNLAVGGQALIEGIMMKNSDITAIAVRKLDGEIVTKVDKANSKSITLKLKKVPFLRGVINFFSSMVEGTKALMFSAKFFDVEETEKEKAKREAKNKPKEDISDETKDIVIYVSVVLGLLLSIGLFIILPNLISTFIVPTENVKLYNVVESVVKFTIFIGYIVLVAQMKDIKRVFEYHGAEHKTIFCYENNLELTVENVKKQQRFHPRCGTNFMIIVLIISVIVFSIIGRSTNIFINIGYRLLLLPVIAGISYEFIRFLGKTKNRFFKIFAKPGLWLQRITTREPDEEQIEVAIKALKLAMGME